ncbi:hypothetical protein RHO13_12130 [Orbus wheelerorum]|uniref:T6SS immunity protein Tli3 family protein n=1 Tax=Orbus wheelerorum TaxID=3074111 RepID=UPI00370D27F7
MLVVIYFIVSIGLFLWGLAKKWYWLVAISYCLFLAVFVASVPLPGKDKTINIRPSQVVFRFDEYRYLQLTGIGCEGKLYYIDEQKQIYNELAVHSARVVTEPFAHTVGDYIFIPYGDYSGIRYSQDGGRTFKSIRVSESGGVRSIRPNNVNGTVVVNNQIFIDSNKGVYRSPRAFGTDTGVELMSPATLKYMEGSIRYSGLRWDEPAPTSLPALPEGYRGWRKWQCRYNLTEPVTAYSRYKPLQQLQLQLRKWIGLGQGASV